MTLLVKNLIFVDYDSWDRPTYRDKETKQYYCLVDMDMDLRDVLSGRSLLYYKGSKFDNEPEHPVDLAENRQTYEEYLETMKAYKFIPLKRDLWEHWQRYHHGSVRENSDEHSNQNSKN